MLIDRVLVTGFLLVGATGALAGSGMTDIQPRSGFPCPPGMIWATVAGKASCHWCDPNTKPADDTQSLTCSAGFSGGITQSRTYTCNQATNSWVAGSWTTTSDTCTQSACLGAKPADETRSQSCPNSWDTGSIEEKRSYSCGGASSGWTYIAGNWTETSNTCAGCNPSSQPPSTQALACPSGQTGTHTQARTVSCSGSSWQAGGWYDTAYTCATAPTCDPNTQPASTQTASCPSGHSGSISQARDVYCSGTTWGVGGWYDTAYNCVAGTCPAMIVPWGSCSGTLAQASYNATGTANNTVAGYSGSSSWYCGSTGWSYSSGSCAAIVTPDYCANIAGNQDSVPGGYTSSNGGQPNGYCCPSGQTWNGSTCVAPTTCRNFSVDGICWSTSPGGFGSGCDTNFASGVYASAGSSSEAQAVVDALYSGCQLHGGGFPSTYNYGPSANGSAAFCFSQHEFDLWPGYGGLRTVHWSGTVCAP
jgi:hypothetical protein